MKAADGTSVLEQAVDHLLRRRRRRHDESDLRHEARTLGKGVVDARRHGPQLRRRRHAWGTWITGEETFGPGHG